MCGFLAYEHAGYSEYPEGDEKYERHQRGPILHFPGFVPFPDEQQVEHTGEDEASGIGSDSPTDIKHILHIV